MTTKKEKTEEEKEKEQGWEGDGEEEKKSETKRTGTLWTRSTKISRAQNDNANITIIRKTGETREEWRITDQVSVAYGVGHKQEGGLADHGRDQDADEEQEEEEELEGLSGHLEPVGGGFVDGLALPGHRLEHVPGLETGHGEREQLQQGERYGRGRRL